MAPGQKSHVKKLLHVFPTFEIGGAQVRFAQIVNELGPAFEHEIIPLNGKTGTEERLGPDVGLQIDQSFQSKGNLALRLANIRRCISARRPDLLLTYNWGAIEWALANLIPACPHLHIEDGFGVEEAKKQFKRRVWTRRLALAYKTHLLVPSQTLKEISESQWKVREKRLHFVPNGIDTKKFHRPPCESLIDQLNLPHDRPIIGTIAALRKEKNLARLIRAFAQAQRSLPMHLLIIGDGGERQALEDLAHSEGVGSNVTFSGHIAQPEDILGALDVFAISSDTEQMPYSVLEAMATGLPIAGIHAGDIRTLVAESNKGLIVERSDEALSQAILELAGDTEQRRLIGADNRARASEYYDETDMIERHRQLWVALSKSQKQVL